MVIMLSVLSQIGWDECFVKALVIRYTHAHHILSIALCNVFEINELGTASGRFRGTPHYINVV